MEDLKNDQYLWVSLMIHPNVAICENLVDLLRNPELDLTEYNYQFYSPLSTVIKHKVVLAEIQIDRLNN